MNPTFKEIEEAKNTLKKAGYAVENLWSIPDVISIYNCSDKEAMDLLNTTLENDNVMNNIWESLHIIAKDLFKLNKKDNNIYYSIYDNDLSQYLAICENSTSIKECFINYLKYRQDDLGEWFTVAKHNTKEFNDIIKKTTEEQLFNSEEYYFNLWINQVSEKFILDDMVMCNFTLEKHFSEILNIENECDATESDIY